MLVKRGGCVEELEWILCPICGNKTRTKIRFDSVLKNFPLFCPKCRKETIVCVKNMNVSVAKVEQTKEDHNSYH